MACRGEHKHFKVKLQYDITLNIYGLQCILFSHVPPLSYSQGEWNICSRWGGNAR